MLGRSAVPTLWLPVMIALGPLVRGLLALASPDLIAANAAWIDWVLVATMAAVVGLAVALGLRWHHLWQGWTAVDRLALLALAVTAMATGWMRAPSPAFSFLILGMSAMVLLAALSLRHILEQGPPALPRRVALALFLALILHAVTLFLLFQNFDPAILDPAKAIPGYKNVRRWGFLLVAGMAMGLGLAGMNQRRFRRLAIWTGMLVLWTLLCWSGTRGGILAFAAAALGTLALRPERLRPLGLPLLVAMVAGALISLALPVPDGDFGLTNAAARAGGPSANGPAMSGRMDLWRFTLQAIREAPLLGHGYAQNIWVGPGPVAHTQVHNLLLEILLAWGLVGALPAFWLLARFGLSAIRRYRQTGDALHLGAFCTLSALGLFALVDGPLFYADAQFAAAVAAAVLFARRPGLPGGGASATQPAS